MVPEALTETGTRLFPRLSRFRNFYLVGGTALALQIGHRRSVDFDLFTPQRLPDRLLQHVKRIFSGSSVVVTYRVPEQLNIEVDGIKTTFFHYEYPVVEKMADYKGVSMAAVKEIAAMKAFSIGKRLSYKDYVDWYFFLKEGHVTLEEVIELAGKKYGNDFNDRLFLGQLASSREIHEIPVDFLRDPVEQAAVQNYLEKTVRNFTL